MTDTTLMRAILSMDAYYRGDGATRLTLNAQQVGLEFGQTILGNFALTQSATNSSSGFFAQAYQAVGSSQTTIAYRGTNDGDDIIHGWPLGGAVLGADQGWDALNFYKQVAGANLGGANIALTGHSLGGGLAGYVAGT